MRNYRARVKANGGKPLGKKLFQKGWNKKNTTPAEDYTTSVDDGHGSVINLDKPLVYGSPASMSDDVRFMIDAFEDKRRDMKVEYGILIDAMGRVLETKRGGKGSVAMSSRNWNQSYAMSHSHPAGGRIGGTFSDADLSAFIYSPTQIMRAAAAEGTYSMTKTNSFNGRELRRAFIGEFGSYGTRRMESLKVENAIASEFKNGDITYSEYEQKHYKNFNNLLVDMHNWFSDNQNTYGYSYTLERRRK